MNLKRYSFKEKQKKRKWFRKMSVVRREGKMVRLKFSGRGLADLDFWTK